MTRCDARIRPFPNPLDLTCERNGEPHAEHRAMLRDYAFPGSETVLTWLEDDRRTYRGEWRPCPSWSSAGCVLPLNHQGRHQP